MGKVGGKPFTTIINSELLREPLDVHAPDCLKTLYTLCTNIINDPKNPKFKTLKARNPRIQTLINTRGGKDALIALGFIQIAREFEEVFIYSEKISDQKIHHLQNCGKYLLTQIESLASKTPLHDKKKEAIAGKIHQISLTLESYFCFVY